MFMHLYINSFLEKTLHLVLESANSVNTSPPSIVSHDLNLIDKHLIHFPKCGMIICKYWNRINYASMFHKYDPKFRKGLCIR